MCGKAYVKEVFMSKKPSELETDSNRLQTIKVEKFSACEGFCLDAGELDAVSKLEMTGLDRLFGVLKKIIRVWF